MRDRVGLKARGKESRLLVAKDTSLKAVVVAGLFAATCAFISLSALPASAQADDLGSVQSELASKAASLEEVANAVNSTGDEVEALEKKIDEMLDTIKDGQSKQTEIQKRISALSTVIYKNGEQLDLLSILTSSESFSDMIEKVETRNKVLEEYASLAVEQERISSELQVEYQQVSKDKDEQENKLSELRDKQNELSSTVSYLQARASELTAEQQAALAAADEAAEKAADLTGEGTTQKSDSDDSSDDSSSDSGKSSSGSKSKSSGSSVSSGWQSGLASAYGGSTDSVKDAISATGTKVDDYSMGVAVPMAWGASAYYGRNVEISYGGKTVVATVVDCGDMAGGSRALDLQPGVFKALGFKSCNDWGVREVSYRFL